MPLKALLVIAASSGVGFAAASWLDREKPAATPAAAVAEPLAFGGSQPLEQRVRALEAAVSDERYARQLLQDELRFLTAELEELASPVLRAGDESAEATVIAQSADGRVATRTRVPGEDRTARLLFAGFSASEAEWIVRRESELQMAALQARYEAGRSGDTAAFYRGSAAFDEALRDELGEDGYERYRAASGASTSVAIGSVIESSPAERAGLKAGDLITRYDGERVFSLSDLTGQTLEGEPGRQVVVDILRDGTPMQVVIPRGPLGISGGRWN